MRRAIVVLSVLVAIALASGFGATAQAEPMVFDKKIGHFKDMSYEALSDEGLSWEERTRLFGGETAHYGPLTAAERKAKEKELKDLLARIDKKLANRCEADIRAWLDKVITAPLKQPGWETDWRKDWSNYNAVSKISLEFGAALLLRAYEIWGDEKYRKAGLERADIFVKAQTHFPQGPYRLKYGVCRIQDGWQTGPMRTVLYAYKFSKDKKYLESAKKCADCLLPLQRDASGGWPDQVPMGGRIGSTGIVHGMSHNDSATTSPLRMMVLMYHLTGEEKYIANIHKLGAFIHKTNLGEGNVVGWAEQYNDAGWPVRARQYELELPYSKALPRSVGPLLIWLYLMDGNEKHMDLLKRAYAWHETVRQKELEPWQIEAWKKISKAAGREVWRPGWPSAWLPDGSNWGGVIHWSMYAWYPVTDEMIKNSGKYTGGRSLIHPQARHGHLKTWAEAGRGPFRFGGNHAGNSLAEVRRAVLEHKRGGYDGLLKYYTNPVEYTPDQYLQARIDAAKRTLDERNIRLAALREQGMAQFDGYAPRAILGAKGRWYGPKHTKWGKAYDDRINHPKYPMHTVWYQWQFVYDAMVAQGRISADAAARGGRGLGGVSMHDHLDSWDVLGEIYMTVAEKENHFDIPLGVNAPAISGDSEFLDKTSVTLDCFETAGTIRYTLDGSEPTGESRRYKKPIRLKETTTVKARFCRTGGRKSEVVEKTSTRIEPRKYKDMTLLPWVRYEYYEGMWDKLPDFSKLKPVASGIAKRLGLDERRREEEFGFRFAGYLEVKKAGRYKFHLGSDDGSRLAIDGKVVVDNDGLHGFRERSGEVDLEPGMREVVITFFERGGGQKLTAAYEGPGIRRGPIPLWCEKGSE